MARSWTDRFGKYLVDPRRMTHNYLLQLTLSLFVTGPCFIDSFFSASTTEIITLLNIDHSQFSLLISIPALTGIVSAVTAIFVSMYGSTLSAMFTGLCSFLGATITAFGLYSRNYATVMIGRFVFVLFWSLLGSFQTVIIFRQYRGPSLAWVLALQILTIRIGTAAGMYFAGPIIELSFGAVEDGFCTALIISAISLISTFIFAYLYRGTSIARIVRPLMIGRRRNAAHVTAATHAEIPWKVYTLCVGIFFYYAGIAPFESFGVDFLTTQVGIQRDISGKMMSIVVMFSFFSPIIAPFLTSLKIQLKCTFAAQCVVAVSMLLTIFQITKNPTITLACIGIGHLFCVNGLWLSLAGVSPNEHVKTEAASIGYAVNSLGTCLTSWSTGKVRDIYGNYTVAYSLLAISVMIAATATFAVLMANNDDDISISPPKPEKDILLTSDDENPIRSVLLPSPMLTPIINDYFSKPISPYQ